MNKRAFLNFVIDMLSFFPGIATQTGLLDNSFWALGNEIGPEIGPARKIGKNNPKIGNRVKILFLDHFFLFSGRDLFLDLFHFLFWAEGPKPIF